MHKKFTLEKLSIAACLVLFVVVCFPLFRNSLPYLDDSYLILMQKQDGFWMPTRSFQSMWGSYRVVYTTLMAPLFSLGDHLWLARTIGLALHMANALLLWYITRRLKWSTTTALIVFALFLLFPFSLEAVAWPSNVPQYPFAPFLMLSGFALAFSPTSTLTKTVCSAVLIGGSVWVHEQVGPLIILLLGVAAAGLPRQRSVPLAAIALVIVAANFLLIYVTRDSNLRLTGPDAGSLRNALKNLYFAPQLIRTTPLGDFYYSTGGLPRSALLWGLAIVGGLLVGWTAIRSRISHPALNVDARGWTEPKVTWFLPAIFVMALGAYVVSLIPTLMTPIPWHTARTIYIPFITFALATGTAIEWIVRRTPASRLVAGSFAALACVLTVWSTIALRAEAHAFDYQVNFNSMRVQELNRRIGAEIMKGDTLLVVSGYYDGDNARPLFGEHFIGLTPSDITAAFKLSVNNPPEYPKIVSRGHWNSVCSDDAGLLQIAESAPTDLRRIAENAGRIVFASWDQNDWHIQGVQGMGDGKFAHPPQIELCSDSTNSD